MAAVKRKRTLQSLVPGIGGIAWVALDTTSQHTVRNSLEGLLDTWYTEHKTVEVIVSRNLYPTYLYLVRALAKGYAVPFDVYEHDGDGGLIGLREKQMRVEL